MSEQMRASAPAGALREHDERQQYLTFSLHGEPFAVGILRVKEIIEYCPVAPVPMVPEFIRGVMNLRGSVVPVIDLAVRFGGARTQAMKRTCIVIIEVDGESGRQDIGVMVDAVHTVSEIPAAEIEPAPAFGARIRMDFISGMGKLNGRFVIILNVNKVLSVVEMSNILNLTQE